MSWSTVQEAVRQAVAYAAKLPDFVGADGSTYPSVEWAGRELASTFDDDGVTIELQMGSVQGQGRDETRYSYDSGLDQSVPTQTGNRQFTVSCMIRTLSQNPDESAQAIAGLLRTRIRNEGSLAKLKAGNVGFVQILASLEVDFPNMDGRMESAAIVDLRLNTTESDTDELASGGYIGTVGYEVDVGAIDDNETVVTDLEEVVIV